MGVTDNKRQKAFIIILMATVISVAYIMLLNYRCLRVDDKDMLSERAFSAIPSDASSLFYFSSIESLNRGISYNSPLFGALFFGEGPLKMFAQQLYSLSGEESLVNFRKLESVISSHYSAKNKISSLLSIDLNSTNIAFIVNQLSLNSNKRDYNGITIYKWRDVEFSVYKDFLLASTSSIILESSLRHLQSGVSIIENEEFSEILSKTYSSELIVFLNHAQVGKLFSGFADRKYLKYSDFISRFSTWSAFHFSNSTTTIEAEGGFLNKKGWGNFSTLFESSKGSTNQSLSIVPANTFALLSIGVKEIPSYILSFARFKEYYKKGDREKERVAMEWFSSLNAMELSCAIIPYGGKLESVTIIRSNSKRVGFFKKFFTKEKPNMVPEDFKEKGYIAHLFGDYFKQTIEEKIFYGEKWIIIGPEKLVQEFAKNSYLSFSMEDFLSQTKARNLLGNENTLLSIVMNGTVQPDSLIGFFRKEIKNEFKSIVSDNNLMITAFQLHIKEDGGVGSKFFAYADSLEALPEPSGVNIEKALGWESDTIVKIPSGPFQLKNFNTGDKEYLTQLPNLWLRLLDNNMKGLWAVPFESQICGSVEQVDYNRNGKLQMLFASQKKIYLLDRSGRFVYPFPKSVDSLILLGPKVYDIKSDGDYAIMLLHADNTLRLYDRLALPYEAWNDISVEETIKDFPELIEVGANKYWVLRTGVRTIIYTINGNPVTPLNDKNRLKPDSPVMPTGDSYVKVRNVQERDILLNLETGKIRRLN